MKDFFDLWVLAQNFGFDGELLANAIMATFSRRQTNVPGTLPTGLADAFYQDAMKQKQWTAFTAKARLSMAQTLQETIRILREFLLPPMSAVHSGVHFRQQWQPHGPWQ